MKAALLTSFIFLAISPCFSQVFVKGVNINELDSVKIIEVMIDIRSTRKGVDVFVDYGQKDNSEAFDLASKSDGLRIFNPGQNSKMFFKSTGAVLNYLERNGWEFIDTKVQSSQHFYYFRRKS